jgi:adenylate kinase
MSDPAPQPTPALSDLEIKDAALIFESVWAGLERERGRENMAFPEEILWLNGAPGAGKGTNTDFILRSRDYTSQPIVVSDLLSSPEARKRIDAGMLVGDREVIELLFRRLLEPGFAAGAVVDGFPRSLVQVECLKLLFARLNDLRRQFLATPHADRFPRPRFHILVLFVDENESVRRQLRRGKEALEHNARAKAEGGAEVEVRKTDLDAEAARNRYRVFKERTYDPLQTLRDIFHYHLINAQGTLAEVQARIVKELQYQSSLELGGETHDRIAGMASPSPARSSSTPGRTWSAASTATRSGSPPSSGRWSSSSARSSSPSSARTPSPAWRTSTPRPRSSRTRWPSRCSSTSSPSAASTRSWTSIASRCPSTSTSRPAPSGSA